MKRFFIIVLCLMLMGAAIAALWAKRLYDEYELALRAPMPIEQSTVFAIKSGVNFKQLSEQMSERGWLRSAQFVYWYARHKKIDLNIKAGTYALEPGMSALDAIAVFVAGREIQHSFRIIEGWNFRQLRSALAASEHLEQTLGDVDDSQLMQILELDQNHPEGLFLADTYLFPPGTSDIETLRRANNALQHNLHQIWQGRDDDLPLETAYEALILASIIEKETAQPHERPLIAGVFVTRLRKGMLLQTDPTVIYGMGENFDGNIRRRDLRADTPYNTYTRKGLPPTPIAIVGLSAIKAAVHPEIDGSLFFVARGDGHHQFSRTYKEHLRAVRKYQLGQRRKKSKANAS